MTVSLDIGVAIGLLLLTGVAAVFIPARLKKLEPAEVLTEQ